MTFDLAAFVSSPLPTSLSSHASLRTSTSSSLSSPRPGPPPLPARRRSRLSMQADAIDFSAVDLATAGKSYAGMVFKPELDAAPVTRCNPDWTAAKEAAINEQVNVEYTASYAYHAIFAYFDRDTVALPGFAKYFKDQSDEERGHAEQFMKYQNVRGGRVVFNPIAVPEMAFEHTDGTSDALYAMDLHLQLEKFVYNKLMRVHKVAEENNDPAMMDFIEGHLEEQLEAIKKAAEYVAQIKRVGTGHGIYHIDRELGA